MQTHRTTRRPSSVRLALQSLEGREVPALLNLTFAGAEATANGALFQQVSAGPADEFDTFLQLRDNFGLSEEGYNTDARPFQLDQLGDLTVTHSLRLGDIPTVTVGGTVYREFLLHIDEGARILRSILTLEQLRFFVGTTGNLTGYNRFTQQLSGLSAVWDLDAGGNNTVFLNDRLNGTTGKGDAVVLIPDSAFAGATDSSFIYLYSRFGGLFDAHAGAEEWGVRPAPVPPTGGSLSGFVYIALDMDGVRGANDGAGLPGFQMELLLNGQVVQTVLTGVGGTYTFSNLGAGEYTIRRASEQEDFGDQLNQPGIDQDDNAEAVEPFENEAGEDLIINITLGAGQNKGEYNFGMIDFSGPPA